MNQKNKINQRIVNRNFILIFLLFSFSFLQAQDAIEISGLVTGQENHEALPGVAVSIKGTVAGTLTNNEGAFKLRTRQRLPFTLVFTSIGFTPQEIEIRSPGASLQ